MIMMALALSTAMTWGAAVADRVDSGWALCEQEGHTRQLAPVGPVTRVLTLSIDGAKSGPPVPSGLQPMVVTAEHVEYMVALGLNSIDVMMSGKPEYTPGFGQENAGIYNVRLKQAGDPACREYGDMITQVKAIGLDEAANFDFAPEGRCLTLVQVEQDLSSYSHFIVSYVDEAASRAGYFRRANELRLANGEVIAKASVFAFDPPSEPTCSSNRNALSLSQFLLGIN